MNETTKSWYTVTENKLRSDPLKFYYILLDNRKIRPPDNRKKIGLSLICPEISVPILVHKNKLWLPKSCTI